MKKKLLAVGASLLLCGFSVPQSVLSQDVALNMDDETLAMYFDMDEVVETATQVPKPIKQVAENVSIITAEEILRMNAHTTSEVLDRMPGVYMFTFGRDFGMTANISLQGSGFHHVLVLVDGIDWNFIAGGVPNLNTIPVAIIKRIEVIRGPGSSTWGSALGGVVNIITKDAGTEKTTGSVSTSYGERDTTDSRVELFGAAGQAGYYLFAGKQRSDGLRNDRNFDNHMFYGKANMTFSPRFSLELTSGYSEPHIDYGNLVSGGLLAHEVDRAFWTTLSADLSLSDTLSLNTLFYCFDQEFAQHLDEDGTYAPVGDLFKNSITDDKKTGVSARLVWLLDNQTLVGGIEYLRSEIDSTQENGDFLVFQGFSQVDNNFGGLDETAFYVNDTIVLGGFTFTPGIRYDRNSITDSFTSPSLGLTYQLSGTTLLRAQAARGFTLPNITLTTLGGAFHDPNPDLNVEKVTSFQAGFETWALKYLWLKATYFDHDVKDAITTTLNPATGNNISVNADKQRRQGFEIEAKTTPFYHFHMQGDFSYVHKENFGSSDNQSLYTSNMALIYDNNTLSAGLYGHYIWFDAASAGHDADDFIWDVTISKRISLSESLDMDLFASGHNIFNGTQENNMDNPSVARWLEAGLRFLF